MNIYRIFADFLAASFYRIGGAIFQSAINMCTDLIGKIDKTLTVEEINNPCSLTNRVADLQSEFLQNFVDVSCVIVLILATNLVKLENFLTITRIN